MDLSELRKRVIQARANPEPRADDAQELVERQQQARAAGFSAGGVVVTPEGVITLEDRLPDDAPRSRVTTEIFAAPADAAAAAVLLPNNSRPLEFDGKQGWSYEITTRGGRDFTFFLYWDRYRGGYEVMLIAPELEKLGLWHEMHIFPEGRLCLTPGGPITALDNAFARSVMWADGVCQMLDGHAWPWGESDDLDGDDDDDAADADDADDDWGMRTTCRF